MPLRTKQLICRSLFLLLGLVPLFGTVGYATWRQVAFDQDGYQSWIAGQLGLDLRIQNVSHPIPDVVRLLGANIVDPETNELLASCDELKLTQSERVVELRVPSVDIPRGQFRRLLNVLHERLLRQSRLLSRRVVVVADNISLQGESIGLIGFRLDAGQGEDGPFAEIKFRTTECPHSKDPVKLNLFRVKRLQSPATNVELFTYDSTLPCSLLFEVPDGLQVGSDVAFQGTVLMDGGPDGWTGEIFGHLKNLDFGAEDPSGVGNRLFAGKAQVTISRAEFENNWMRRLDGRIYAREGQVNRRWLAELIAKLRLDSSRSLPEEGQSVAFDELGIAFQINGEQAVLSGVAGANTSRVMLSRQGQPLVGLTNVQPIKTLRLFQALFQLSEEQVPVSTDQNRLLRMLPLGDD